MERRLAIVMGRNYTSRLGMIRAAGEAGCDVAVVQTDRDSGKGGKPVDSTSKYITGGYYRSPMPNADHLITLLRREFSGRDPRPVLLPTDDYTASTVDLNIGLLREDFLFPSIDGEPGRVVRFMDKAVQKALARKAGFDVAKGWTAQWKDERYAIPEDVEFPCFVKPEISFKGANKQSMRRCDTREALDAVLSKIEGREDYPILIEQYIDVEREYDIPGLALGDRIVIPGIIRKGEIFMGVTATGTMLPAEDFPLIREKTERFMSQIGFTGLIDIEVLESGGVCYFNELNLRFGASGYGMTGSGVNLPGLFIRHLCGEAVPAQIPLRAGKTFASEKVLLQEYTAGRIGRREYRDLIRGADFTFIDSAEDPAPAVAFRRSEAMTLLKARIRQMLHIRR